MTLNAALFHLKNMEFIDNKTEICISVYKGKNTTTNDRLFECERIPVKYAETFFGNLEILVSRIKVYTTEIIEHATIFWFLLNVEESDEGIQ